MSDAVLRVDPTVLQRAGTAFGQASEQLGSLRAEAGLSDAAAAVPELATGAACRDAEALIASQVASLAESVQAYSRNLGSAAQQYQGVDQSAASKVGNVEIP